MVVGISGKMGSGKDLVYNMLCELSDVDFENKKFAYPIKQVVSILLGCTIEQLEDREFKETELGEEWWYYKFDDIMLPISDRGLFIQTVNSIVFSPLDESEVDTYIIKLTPRKLLQLLGTEAGRHVIHPNIWVNALFADYVCDDCGQKECSTDEEDTGQMIHRSFPNWIITDVRFPNEAKAIKDKGGILIRINRPQYLDNGLVIRKDEHLSETALDDYDKFDHVIENDGTVQDLIDKVMALNIV